MSTSSVPSVEGELEYHVPTAGKACKLWYKVVGDLSSGRRPLLTLHGGPGCCHTYLLPLTFLATRYNTPVIFFDQIGSGKSTHFPEKNGDEGFWTEEFFLEQIDRLLKHLGIEQDFDLFGHSWGGMLGARYAVRLASSAEGAFKPGLRRLILSSPPADMHLWVEAQNRLREKLPEDVQSVLKKHEDEGTTSSKEYMDAVGVFYERHLCLLKPMPQEVAISLGRIEEDPTVYHTMLGPSEFFITGSLKDWSIIDEAHKISVPTLLLNGRHDEAQDSTVAPFFWKIPNVKWFTFANSAHMSHFEEPELFEEIVKGFLLA
ncbi:hypothetical protein AX16_001324 [Volvariella volvacea WC 439]|nr:hypothetical protein AX16_001324 [Volvariella volvacea WC 439]